MLENEAQDSLPEQHACGNAAPIRKHPCPIPILRTAPNIDVEPSQGGITKAAHLQQHRMDRPQTFSF
jgi:hypothetical protein